MKKIINLVVCQVGVGGFKVRVANPQLKNKFLRPKLALKFSDFSILWELFAQF
jgi:hypothetical protein